MPDTTAVLRIPRTSGMSRPDLAQLESADFPPLRIVRMPAGLIQPGGFHVFVIPDTRPSFADHTLTLWSGAAPDPDGVPQHVVEAVDAFNADLTRSWFQLIGDYTRYELAEHRRQLTEAQQREQESARYLVDLTALQAARA